MPANWVKKKLLTIQRFGRIGVRSGLDLPGRVSNRRPLIAPLRSPERSDAQVEKDHDNDGGGEEGSVIWPTLPACTCLPEHWCEDHDGQQEENAEDLEQDFAADAAEGLEEAREPATDSAGCLTCGTTSSGRIGRRLLSCSLRIAGVLAHDGAARHAACYAQAYTQYSSDGLRFHFDMMVAAADTVRAAGIQRRMPVAGAPFAK